MIDRRKTAQEMAEEIAAKVLEQWDAHTHIDTYILGPNHEHIPARTLEWARWYETADRRVALTRTDHYEISTVFLGLDHSWSGGPPVLYETMVFPLNVVSIKTGKRSMLEEDMDRYCTWEEAEAGHAEMVRKVLDFERQSPEERNKA